VGGALVGVGAEDLRQRGRRLQARRRQIDVGDPDRVLDVLGAEAQVRADSLRRLPQLLRGGLLVLVAPAPELAPPGRDRYQCTPLIR
jgi:hypothetical protein